MIKIANRKYRKTVVIGATRVTSYAIAESLLKDGLDVIATRISEHDNIADHCHIETNRVNNGNASAGQGSFVYNESITKEGNTIVENSFIKARSIVK